MFILPAAIFVGKLDWARLRPNLVAVFLGNLTGGAVFVGLGPIGRAARQPEPMAARRPDPRSEFPARSGPARTQEVSWRAMTRRWMSLVPS